MKKININKINWTFLTGCWSTIHFTARIVSHFLNLPVKNETFFRNAAHFWVVELFDRQKS